MCHSSPLLGQACCTFPTEYQPNARGEPRQELERGTSGGCWRRLPGRAGGYPPGPPTDPDVRDELIRFLGSPSPRLTLVHHCATLHGHEMVWTILGVGRT
jgi:hypothetical protein